MDILHLVDRLEELFNSSKSVPLTKHVLIDEERMLELIDQLRLSIPEEIKKADQVLNQKDRIIAQAQEESNRLINLAKEKVNLLVEQDAIVKQAQSRAEEIKSLSLEETKVIKREADEYAVESLIKLESEIERIQTQIRNGIRSLKYNSSTTANNSSTPTENGISENTIN